MTLIQGHPDYSSIAQRLLGGIQRKGLSTEPVLQQVGFSENSLSDPHQRVNGQQLLRLMKAATAFSKDEFLGFTPHPCKLGTLAMAMETGVHCENLYSLIEHWQRFFYCVTDDIEIGTEYKDQQVAISFDLRSNDHDPEGFLAEHFLLLIHRFLSWSIGVMIPLQAVFATLKEPSSAERLYYYLRPDWQSDQDGNKFFFHRQYLSQPIIRVQKEVAALHHAEIPNWPDDEKSWAFKVRCVLKMSYENHQPGTTIEAVASTLHITSRNLRRQLSAEGTNYQMLLDELRRDIAFHKLGPQQQSIADVAHYLGFSESRSFSRAFKRWTGKPPGKYVN